MQARGFLLLKILQDLRRKKDSRERGRHARWVTRLAGPFLAHTGTFWRGAKKRSPRRPLLGNLVKTTDYADCSDGAEEEFLNDE
jgi:hypothetical protein